MAAHMRATSQRLIVLGTNLALQSRQSLSYNFKFANSYFKGTKRTKDWFNGINWWPMGHIWPARSITLKIKTNTKNDTAGVKCEEACCRQFTVPWLGIIQIIFSHEASDCLFKICFNILLQLYFDLCQASFEFSATFSCQHIHLG